MKKLSLKYIRNTTIISAGIIWLLQGCISLEEEPVDFVAPSNFYKTVEQINSVLASNYSGYSGYWDTYAYNLYNASTFSDELRGQSLDWTNLATNNNSVRFYRDLFRGISTLNNGLQSVDGLDASQEVIDELKGQLLFARAFNYYALSRTYGGVPIVTEKTTVEEYATVTRSNRFDVFVQIAADLEAAIPLLPDTWPEGFGVRPTKTTAQGMAASLYLTWGSYGGGNDKYQMARDYAEDVMESDVHSLIPEIGDVFKTENKYASEFLFSLQVTGDLLSRSTDALIWLPDELGGWGDVTIDTLLQNKYPDQPRRYAYIATGMPQGDGSITPFASGLWYNNKYAPPYITMDEYNNFTSPANTPFLRYAEILLIFAEADNALNGPTAEGIAAFNEVRDRANGYVANADAPLLTTAITQEDFLDEILDERLFELCFEHVRIYDIWRHDLLLEANPDLAASLDEGDYHFPIPLVEIEGSKGRILQNPGNYPDGGFGFFVDDSTN